MYACQLDIQILLAIFVKEFSIIDEVIFKLTDYCSCFSIGDGFDLESG